MCRDTVCKSCRQNQSCGFDTQCSPPAQQGAPVHCGYMKRVVRVRFSDSRKSSSRLLAELRLILPLPLLLLVLSLPCWWPLSPTTRCACNALTKAASTAGSSSRIIESRRLRLLQTFFRRSRRTARDKPPTVRCCWCPLLAEGTQPSGSSRPPSVSVTSRLACATSTSLGCERRASQRRSTLSATSTTSRRGSTSQPGWHEQGAESRAEVESEVAESRLTEEEMEEEMEDQGEEDAIQWSGAENSLVLVFSLWTISPTSWTGRATPLKPS